MENIFETAMMQRLRKEMLVLYPYRISFCQIITFYITYIPNNSYCGQYLNIITHC
ncbi:hypothetical protein BDW75DRAFT_210062, partial [Aspergillus navahoensis]